MLPYFIANFTALAFFHIAFRQKLSTAACYLLIFFSSIPLIVIAGLKFRKVGTDTGSYVFFYNHIISFTDAFDMASEHGEIGYWLLNSLGHQISDNYFALFTLTAIIITACYMYALKQFNLKTLSLFTLLFIGPYYFQLNGNRQAISIAIFAISTIFIIKEQPIKYIISILVGFLFHKSMIICLPIYFIFRGQIKPRKIALILLGFFIFIVFFQSFINVASGVDSRYSSYGDARSESGGVVVSLFNIILLAWFFIVRIINRQYLANRTYDVLLSLYLLGALVSIISMVLSVDPSGFLRLSVYFIQLNMFLLPLSVMSFKDNQTRHVIVFAAILLMMAYFYMTTSTFSNLTPYRFNPILGL
ncbi:EpsG family protein [Thalassotalea sp. M1531]|uniref:EpsG family protein n=1 Tax=Thalassotalea algicola TaxID=2716224 RepID=A0A7Y0L9J8_9GAMM|nr:EpsG family protein [Thalassotalea algicola]NMP30450.1 EpsG family protein [Thalassotalea algicola]